MTRSESSEPSAPVQTSGSASPSARRASRALALALAALLLSPSASAADQNPSVPDPAAAALFQSGRDLLDRGKWEEACSKFEASMILYPATSTLLNIARCYERKGKIALAWSAYQRALVLNRETQGEERKRALEEVAKKGLAAVEPRLPRIKLALRGTPAGLRVTHNGQDVPAAMLSTVIPVDPGPQSITAEAPGYMPFQRTVDVDEGELEEVPIVLERGDEGGGAGSGPRIPTWAWVAGAGGIALLAGSAAFRVDQAYAEGLQRGWCRDDLSGGCPAKSTKFDVDANNARKNRDFALFASLGSAGVLALGAAIVGIVTAHTAKPSAKSSAMITPWIGPGSVGGGIGGRF
ncbi:PEGA domain-containing protein [Polyangium aurulentum]|uniref:PEGA domain-containing protein n=1 Tax=Polyangium aurulentum TaxID=2567896 RepID=UPI0010AECFD3|nr:PEGA domain-containing protein [Polyangium aurulentum]UQA62063.1 PEGA domain-containing protein [Polyangium aurulentum]